MSMARKTILLRAFLALSFVAGWAIAIALYFGFTRGDLGMTVRGRVVDRQSGRPIPGAVVVGTSGTDMHLFLTRDKARTNQDRIFELEISPTRETLMRIDARGYSSNEDYVDPMHPDFVEVKMARKSTG